MTQATGLEGLRATRSASDLAEALSPSGDEALRLDDIGSVQLLEEVASVSKRRLVKGTVRVTTRTETYEQQTEVTLDRNVVEVTRVPVGRNVEVAPQVRTVGDTTIVPVVEERLVMVKQLFLVEELHVRRHVEQTVAREAVPLRRQHATVERFDSEGRLIVDKPA